MEVSDLVLAMVVVVACVEAWVEELAGVLVEGSVEELEAVSVDAMLADWSMALGSPLLWSGSNKPAEHETTTFSKSWHLLCSHSRIQSTTRATRARAAAKREGSRK